MEKKRYTYLNNIEFEMTFEDARLGYHQGDCQADCEQLIQVPYIKEQLSKLTDEQMRSICREYGVDGVDKRTRTELEVLVVWLAAGDISVQLIAPLDRNGNEIKKGDKVLWHDPEGLTSAEYEVFDTHEEIVYLSNSYGECEALPQECEIIS